MRVLCLLATLLVVGSTAAPAWGADLAKIDRTIAKEPAYKSKPKYCLLVFGPGAKTRAWLVLDGDTLYADRNGDGDLTEKGERFVPARQDQWLDWEVGAIAGRTARPSARASPSGTSLRVGPRGAPLARASASP
jgi:hypothetical protein